MSRLFPTYPARFLSSIWISNYWLTIEIWWWSSEDLFMYLSLWWFSNTSKEQWTKPGMGKKRETFCIKLLQLKNLEKHRIFGTSVTIWRWPFDFTPGVLVDYFLYLHKWPKNYLLLMSKSFWLSMDEIDSWILCEKVGKKWESWLWRHWSWYENVVVSA